MNQRRGTCEMAQLEVPPPRKGLSRDPGVSRLYRCTSYTDLLELIWTMLRSCQPSISCSSQPIACAHYFHFIISLLSCFLLSIPQCVYDMLYNFLVFFALLANSGSAFPFDERQIDYNLNTNKNAQNPLQYSGEWEGHTYFPSPDNWRFPIYTFFLDRWVDGDPTNNDNNGTVFEHDPTSNQLRHGGDVQGVVDSLDYLQGMGVKGIYVAGTPFINLPSKIDGYSVSRKRPRTLLELTSSGQPIDFTLLDHHTGTIAEWRDAVEQIHKRGMYIILDTTGSTMADLIGFEGYLNTSAPFLPQEHQVRYKSTEHYVDFAFDNTYDNTCEYPRFWNTSGQRVLQGCTEADDKCALFDQLKGCYDSEFDQVRNTS